MTEYTPSEYEKLKSKIAHEILLKQGGNSETAFATAVSIMPIIAERCWFKGDEQMPKTQIQTLRGDIVARARGELVELGWRPVKKIKPDKETTG